MDVKMNLKIITKNHAADSKIGFPLKIDFRADWTHESIPRAWELTSILVEPNLIALYVDPQPNHISNTTNFVEIEQFFLEFIQ